MDVMDVIEVLPSLQLLRFQVGQAYLWSDGDELTLIDAGVVGSAASIVRASRRQPPPSSPATHPSPP